MTDPQLEFRGLALDDPLAAYFEVKRGFLGAPQVRGTDYAVARREGRLSGNRVADTLNVLIEGFVGGSTAAEWRTNTDALIAVLNESLKEPGLLLARPPFMGLDDAGGDAWILARVKNWVEGAIYGSQVQTWSIELESVVPYWNRDVAPEVPIETTLTIATDTTWRTMDLTIDGVNTNAEPASWKLPGFDDSGAPWGNAITGAGSVAYFDIPGADKISDDGVGTVQVDETSNGIWIARKSFQLPALPDDDPTIHVTVDNELYGLWINGVLLGTLGNTLWGSDHTFTIDRTDLVEGENVIAAKVKCDPAPGNSMVQSSVAITYTA